MNIEIVNESGYPLPQYATNGSVGFDLLVPQGFKETSIPAGGKLLVDTKIKLSIPTGYEAQVRSRSGLALNNEIVVLNSPGTIDSDYRGSVGVILKNFGKNYFPLMQGMKIAQVVICPIVKVAFVEVKELSKTIRGEGGFGSTGV